MTLQQWSTSRLLHKDHNNTFQLARGYLDHNSMLPLCSSHKRNLTLFTTLRSQRRKKHWARGAVYVCGRSTPWHASPQQPLHSLQQPQQGR
jgi:hypothetical protein